MVGSECAGAHTHHAPSGECVAQQKPFWPIQRGCVHCSSHSLRGILFHPMEGLCLGPLLVPLFPPGCVCYFRCSSRHRLRLFLSALPLPHRGKNQPGIWRSQLASTLPRIFPSSSSTAKSAARSWLLSLAPTVLNTPPSSRLKNSSTYLIPLKSRHRYPCPARQHSILRTKGPPC